MTASVGPSEPQEAFLAGHLFVGAGEPVRLPHLAPLLAAIALRLKPRKPACIVLPSTENLAELIAVLVALHTLASDAADLTKQASDLIFVPGTRVRTLVGGYVFKVVSKAFEAGASGVWLQSAGKKSHESQAKIFFKNSAAVLFERTLSRRPIGTSSRVEKPPMTGLDLMTGATTFGNTCLMRNHVVLLSTRAGFERFLEQTDLSTPLSRAAAPNGTFAEQMCWGFVQEDGHVVVTNPDGALGEPLVAVNREPYDLRKLLAQENIGRRTIVTSDLNAVLRNPGLFEEFAERHSLLALVESRRREDVMPLQQKGWTVWEPAPWDILPDETPSPRTGLRGLDASVRASRREMKSVESWMPCKAPLVATLYQTFQDLSSAISQEALENDDVAATLQLCKDAFFRATSLFEFPSGESTAQFCALLGALERPRIGFRMACGEGAADKVRELAVRLRAFLDSGREGDPTVKGAELLRVVTQGNKVGLRQVLAVGASRTRLLASQFLSRHETQIPCRTPSDLHADDAPQRVIVTGALGRGAFSRIVDPWPAEVVLLYGYEFETDLYRSRLAARRRDQERLRLDASARTEMTGMPPARFGRPRDFPSIQVGAPPESVERLILATEWHADKRPAVPRLPGEEIETAIFCRFLGGSWAALTPDHQCLVLDAGSDGRTSVRSIDANDLRVGQRIVWREQGERDVIRDVAERLCGTAEYERLLKDAKLWRQALDQSRCTPEMISSALKAAGIKRNLETIRGWLRNPQIFGPRQYSDIDAIADAFGSTIPAARWEACSLAIHKLRGLHITAGNRLGDSIREKLRDFHFESAGEEVQIELDIGSVWILELQHLDSEISDWPVSRINRLQWKTDAARVSQEDLFGAEV